MFKPTVKTSLKSNIKKQIKKLVQPIRISDKDKGKLTYFNALSLPIKGNHIFYEAFAGMGILDNPRAIFKYLLSQPDFESFIHIWSIDNMDISKDNIDEFLNHENVIIVQKDSDAYYRYLATCKYLISNSTFGYFFSKRSEQIYINTWHGVPTKYMGYEHSIERVENARGPARNYLTADYLLSANRFMTEVMYKRAYKMEGLFEGKLLEIGHPRSDALFNTDKDYIYNKLNQLGIKTDKKIILYAPTWKGNLYNQLDYDVNEFKSIVEQLSQSIDQDNYRIYLRVHYFLYKILASDPELEKILIPFTIDTNELLSVVDVLISDYSSIFFDFIATGRPMLFYVPDLDSYSSGRGLYVPIEKLPGLVSSDISNISKALSCICTDSKEYLEYYQPLLKEMQEWCIYNDDGQVCKRVADIIFKCEALKETETLKIINGLDTVKKKILICINTGLANKDIYKDLTNRLSNVDYENTDVTLLTTSFKDEALKSYFNKLPNAVRILVWYALPFVSPNHKAFYEQEVVRTLGYTHFDEVNFVGDITEYWAAFANAVLDR